MAEQQIKQLEQEKQLIATQAVLDGEIQERIRLVRDLHDSPGSILAAAKYNLLSIRKTLVMEPPEALSSYGLRQSTADFCNTISIVKFIWYGDDTRLEPKPESMVYRIVHELVSNAIKHSGASNILVQIVQETDRLALTVQDDGCGFDPEQKSDGMGLSNIRTRTVACNGHLIIDSKRGTGTEINIEIPIMNY